VDEAEDLDELLELPLDELLEPLLDLEDFMLVVLDFVVAALDRFESSDLREELDLGRAAAGGDLCLDD
jgi:hypothetical protein